MRPYMSYLPSWQCHAILLHVKWLLSISGELNNCSIYFSPFANVNQTDKTTIGDSIGARPEATSQPWDYKKRILVAEKVTKFKVKFRDPEGKQSRGH